MPRVSQPLLRTIAVLLLLSVWGCGRSQRPTHVILISIDTCRADRLGCYGFPRPTSPNLDALAQEAIRFTHVATTVPMTFPAHCSMLTGVTPLVHGVHENLGYTLDDRVTTIAEALREIGYRTGGVVGATVLDSRFNLNQGFESWDDTMPGQAEETGAEGAQRRAAAVTQLGIQWLDQHREEKGFLFLHYYDPHVAYDPPEPFASTFSDDLYAGEVAYTDQQIGRLFQHLRQIGLYSSSLIVVVGDHGEGLGEHGEATHDYFIYESTIHIPLLIKPPHWKKPVRRDDPAGITDLAPTILRATGLKPPMLMDGRDLLAEPPTRFDDAGPEGGLYSESLTPTRYGCNALFAIRSGDWKFIQSTRPELYNLATDPREETNLVATEPQRTAQLQQRLQQLMTTERARTVAAGRTVPDRETLERLRSLGYTSGNTTAEGFEFQAGRPDAKDRLEFHAAFGEAVRLVNSADWVRARAACEQLLLSHPDMPEANVLLGDVAFAQGFIDEAIRRYETSLRDISAGGETEGLHLTADRSRIHYRLGNSLAALGRSVEAVAQYRAALSLQENDPDARLNLGITLGEMGRYAEAAREFRTLLAQDPEHVEAQYNLGLSLLTERRPEEAAQAFQAALRLRPSYGPARVKLGDLELARGRPGEAAKEYAEALRHPPVPAEAWYKLPRALVTAGRLPEAVDAYRQAAHALSDEPAVAAELAWILSTCADDRIRNGPEAVPLAERACRQSGNKDLTILATLAAAYAEVGRYDDAVRVEEQALALARMAGSSAGSAGPADLAATQARIVRYRNRQPTRVRF